MDLLYSLFGGDSLFGGEPHGKVMGRKLRSLRNHDVKLRRRLPVGMEPDTRQCGWSPIAEGYATDPKPKDFVSTEHATGGMECAAQSILAQKSGNRNLHPVSILGTARRWKRFCLPAL